MADERRDRAFRKSEVVRSAGKTVSENMGSEVGELAFAEYPNPLVRKAAEGV